MRNTKIQQAMRASGITGNVAALPNTTAATFVDNCSDPKHLRDVLAADRDVARVGYYSEIPDVDPSEEPRRRRRMVVVWVE